MLIAALLVPCALATVVGLVLLYPPGGPAAADDVTAVRVDGHVTTATEGPCTEDPSAAGCCG